MKSFEEVEASFSEKTLALAVQAWLVQENWDCYPEAQIRQRGPRADIIAMKQPLLWVIETKLSLNFSVIEQALRWKSLGALYTSIAVVKPRRKRNQRFVWHSNFIDRFFRQEGLGLILFDPDDKSLLEAIEPKLHRYNHAKAKIIISQLDQRMKRYIPGSTGREGYSSPHQRTIENALQFISKKKMCSINDLLSNIKTHFRIRAKARRFLINTLCKLPELSYQLDGYNVIFQIKENSL